MCATSVAPARGPVSCIVEPLGADLVGPSGRRPQTGASHERPRRRRRVRGHHRALGRGRVAARPGAPRRAPPRHDPARTRRRPSAGPTPRRRASRTDAPRSATNPSPLRPSPTNPPPTRPFVVWRGAEQTPTPSRGRARPPTRSSCATCDELDDEHFEPGPTAPLPPQEDLQFWGIIVGLVGGPLLLLWLVLFRPDVSGWWTLGALGLTVRGFVLLVHAPAAQPATRTTPTTAPASSPTRRRARPRAASVETCRSTSPAPTDATVGAGADGRAHAADQAGQEPGDLAARPRPDPRPSRSRRGGPVTGVTGPVVRRPVPRRRCRSSAPLVSADLRWSTCPSPASSSWACSRSVAGLRRAGCATSRPSAPRGLVSARGGVWLGRHRPPSRSGDARSNVARAGPLHRRRAAGHDRRADAGCTGTGPSGSGCGRRAASRLRTRSHRSTGWSAGLLTCASGCWTSVRSWDAMPYRQIGVGGRLERMAWPRHCHGPRPRCGSSTCPSCASAARPGSRGGRRRATARPSRRARGAGSRGARPGVAGPR